MAERKKPAMTVGKKGSTLPEYVKAKDLAELLDISVPRISQLKKDGVIKTETTSAGERYPLIDSVRSYIRNLRDAKSSAKTTQSMLEERKTDAEATLKEAKAEIAQIELKELLGKMHRSEDVEAVTIDLIYAVRGALTALPGRLAVDVVRADTAAEASAVIRTEVNKILEELAAYRYDPEVYAKRVSERTGMESEENEDEDD